MSKYFQQYGSGVLLEDYKCNLEDSNERKIKAVDYLEKCLGNVVLPGEIIETFLRQFHIYGGPFNVRNDMITINGIYDIYNRIPGLSVVAIEELFSLYINDMFEEYDLVNVLKNTVKLFDKTDDAFNVYIEFVKLKIKESQKRFIQDAEQLEIYRNDYLINDCIIDYIDYLKELVIKEHISCSDILKSLPSKELIEEDVKQLKELSEKYRIYFGVGMPISYLMTKTLAKTGNLCLFSNQPTYYISNSYDTINTTFTKQDFIDSVNYRKEKILKK